ncbi:Transcriptional activator of fatty acid utilization [Agyrium rufum]|nr:Transcriptional activator of fatty acid utilization [Agyrium rufum]
MAEQTHQSPAAMSGSEGASRPPKTNAAPNSQTPGHPSFRRQRASRACETCHSRKVRCDAASLGVPCTNCVAFSIECKIPTPKRKKAQGKGKDSDSSDSAHANSPAAEQHTYTGAPRSTSSHHPTDGMPATTLSEAQQAQQTSAQGTYAQFMKPKFARAPIKEAGRVAYLGESSNLSLLVHDRHGTTDVVHYPLPETVRGTRARLTELDSVEIDILHQRGAFLLPPRALCDELVELFFKWVAPVVPVINRSRFMRRYRDNKNPPSLLLLQAILLAGSRVCTNPQLMDANGSTTPAAITFYKRAKALYDANYEDDRVTIVQALVLMGWYWEGPEGKYKERAEIASLARSDIASDVTKNVFYWSRVATIVAQGSGMHRSVESSQLSKPDKRLWKRIWWTLFTRDRSVAVALGRPVHINTDDSDVEMVTEDDFIEDELDQPAEFQPDSIHVQFFLHYVRLCEIMGLVLSQQYSVASKARRQNAIDLTHSDMALADWLQNCPKEVYWEQQRHHFCTTLCLLHRAHMPPATSGGPGSYPDDAAYPSRTIAFQAAGMITAIVENLQAHDEIRFTPAFIVYSLFSALIMHVYQMRSSIKSVVEQTQERMQVCMNALKEVSKVWLVAKMVHTLFESILGNKVLEERLQKAPGKRHKKPRVDAKSHTSTNPSSQPPTPLQQAKRPSYDAIDPTIAARPPAPQESYERSRPETPAITPSREMTQNQLGNMPAPGSTLSPIMRNDYLNPTGALSRNSTRQSTPFGAMYPVPATPPDLFLVTRPSPILPQDMWENFQPDQLFPDGTNIQYQQSSYNTNQNLDPQLQMATQQAQMQAPPRGSSGMAPQANMQPGSGTVNSSGSGGRPGLQQHDSQGQQQQQQQHQQQHQQQQGNGSMQQGSWHQQQQSYPMAQQHDGSGGGQDDAWRDGSRGQPQGQMGIPSALNVEDWFQFFGMNNGDLSGVPMVQHEMHGGGGGSGGGGG